MSVQKSKERNQNVVELLNELVELTPEEQNGIVEAAEAALAFEHKSGDLSVQIDTPDHIQTLNRDFRHVDRVTDVLTFPAWEGEDPLGGDGYLGDIMICYERAAEQAEEYGHSLARELAFLTVHGVLHLLGYDHMTEEEECVMRAKQTEILEGLGLKR